MIVCRGGVIIYAGIIFSIMHGIIISALCWDFVIKYSGETNKYSVLEVIENRLIYLNRTVNKCDRACENRLCERKLH